MINHGLPQQAYMHILKQTEEETEKLVRRISRDYHEPIGEDTTRVGQSNIAGLGLFSARPIEKGEVVARFRQPGDPLPEEGWSKLHPLLNLPHDAGIQHDEGRRTTVYSDASWFEGDEFLEANPVPKWYRLNHDEFPNTKPSLKNNMLEWRALNFIPARQELTFNYGKVPKEWTSKAGSTSMINESNILRGPRRRRTA